MEGSELIQHQVITAWINAGAAVVQAIGVIAAIAVSIQLGRSSARREREAEHAATQRIKDAEDAANRRAEAAEKAADLRIERSKTDAHNELIRRITSLGALAVEECQDQIKRSEVDYASNTGSVSGSFGSRRLGELREHLPQVKQQTADIELLAAISHLQDVLQEPPVEGQGGVGYVAALRAQLDRIYDALHNVDGLHR